MTIQGVIIKVYKKFGDREEGNQYSEKIGKSRLWHNLKDNWPELLKKSQYYKEEKDKKTLD